MGVGNGTDALAIAFGALGLAAGDGVLVADDEGGYAATAAAQLGLRVRVHGPRRTWRPRRDASGTWRPWW